MNLLLRQKHKNAEHFRNHRPTEASEMFHSPEMPEQSLFVGFWVDDIVTKDKPTRYGKNNHFTYAEQPSVIGQGSQRKINIYCAIPAA